MKYFLNDHEQQTMTPMVWESHNNIPIDPLQKSVTNSSHTILKNQSIFQLFNRL